MSRAVFPILLLGLAALLLVACGPTAPASSTAPPPKAAEAPKPSPAASPLASPAASPVASPSPAAAAPTVAVPRVSEQARADAESFYRGKTVRVIVGFSAGGGYDIVARLVARYLGKYIPESPTVVVENQPGAAGVIAANTVFNTAPKDGSVLHLFNETAIQAQLTSEPGVQFDARTFTWLGSTQTQTNICVARVDSGITSFQDLVSGGKQLIVGATAPGSNTNDFPATLREALGANTKVVPGYAGTNEIRLAMQRGETNGACIPWESFKVTSSDWVSGPNKFATILIQQGAEKHPELVGVPMADELAQNEGQKRLIRAVTGGLAISKPMVAPPGLSADRAAVLRAAFLSTMNDPELRQEAGRAKVDLFVRPPEPVERMVDEILSTPHETVNEIKRILAQT